MGSFIYFRNMKLAVFFLAAIAMTMAVKTGGQQCLGKACASKKSKNLLGKKSGCTGPACTQKKALLAKKSKAVTPGCTGPACSQKRPMLTINKVSGSGSCVGPACNKETMEAKRVQSLISKGKT